MPAAGGGDGKIGQLLIEAAAINTEQLTKALETQRERGGLVGRILVPMGACGPADISAAVRRQMRYTMLDPSAIALQEEAVALLNAGLCRRWRLVPFELLPGKLLCVAMANVLSVRAQRAVEEQSGCTVRKFTASVESISAAIDRTYGGGDG
ncbi:MAG: GspE/PulE/PilB domain-containing protein [Planctomycetota bacterium]|jgi:hypothetical protein